ncbi:primosomal protein N' [Lysinimonas soli]|uniref:Primosomal protein N n=1 Tax=Lysinimonas soli TaxID=1074233 RepID=A0ABW0NP12_9MICO
MPAARIARILVDSPLPQLDRLLDYRIPEGMDGIVPGVRVTVPLRSAGRVAEGFVVELSSQQDFPGPLSDIAALASAVPILRPEVWALARAVADRAAGSAGDVLRLAIPPRQVRVEKAWLARGREPERAPIAAPALEGYPDAVTEALEADERLVLGVDPGVTELGDGVWVGRWAVTLARVAARVVAAGRSAIVVAPDYRDQEQLAAALAPLLPADAVVRLDARQSNPDRYRGILRALGQNPVVLLGNRSVVYAPAARLGLIAIWNDGDPLLGEPLAPYVHARDAALIRQEQQGGALVIAGHTRTTEAERLVELGYLRELGPTRPRRSRVIPTANIPAQDRLAAQARIPSIAWREARAGSQTGPVLVQVARPGYAPGLRCGDCGASARCRVCDGPLHQSRRGGIPSCSWCGAPEASWRCTNCQSTRLRPAGAGASRTADELGRAFPGVRVIVADGERAIQAVDAKPAIVVATRGAEPIAAGGYRAVLLLDGERMVARETLRVGEDCLRWWSDAASLAADDAPVVLVGVGGALASAMVTGRQAEYARAELADRRLLRFPPAARVATLQGTPEAVAAALSALPAEVDPVGTTEVDGRARAIVRFDYAHGAEVAAVVRSEIIRQATMRRKPVPGQVRRGRQPLPLRARFDDPEPFAE